MDVKYIWNINKFHLDLGPILKLFHYVCANIPKSTKKDKF